jgi:uncharacterized protein DUF4031
MSVYVDDMRAPFQSVPWKRTMKMCHMIADSHEELLEMANKIGLQRKWLQGESTYREHFDVCLAKRKLAIAAGAKEVTQKELGRMIVERDKKKP